MILNIGIYNKNMSSTLTSQSNQVEICCDGNYLIGIRNAYDFDMLFLVSKNWLAIHKPCGKARRRGLAKCPYY